MPGGNGSGIIVCATLLNARNAGLWMPAYRFGDRSVFLYGFAKNERENIEEDELATLREIAAGWLEADHKRLKDALEEGFLQEVNYGEEK